MSDKASDKEISMPANFFASRGWSRFLIAFLFFIAAAIAASAQTFSQIHVFTGPDGSFPNSALVQGFDGQFYGATAAGGSNFDTGCKDRGCGTVFGVGRFGNFTSLYTFCSQTNCADGQSPTSLIEGAAGTFFGVASTGGDGMDGIAAGTAFSLTASETESTLYTFCSLANCADGDGPSSIVEGFDGSFHGVTQNGGNTVHGPSGNGSIFRLTPGGKLTTTYDFCSNPKETCVDGSQPLVLIQGADGNFYGVALSGGLVDPTGSTAGTLFKVGPSGGFTRLYSFCSLANCSDGVNPKSVLFASDGNLYGVTQNGGIETSEDSTGEGTVFKATTGGALSTLYSFCATAGCPDGGSPTSLVEGTDGNFYGTTGGGGTNKNGTVFKLTPSGILTTLHNFDQASGQGAGPISLIQGTDGAFYGTTSGGGAKGRGTVFRIDVGLAQFVQPVLTFGKVGARVTILGTDLTGATAVSFNGTAATTTSVTATSIVTTVPTGATSGTITVTTPSGTLNSNVAFTVLP
jgi:uncharacterized repeat protein (TIGR03803 family)